MLLNINPTHPEERKLKQVLEILERGGIIIYPTDTVYGIGCDFLQQAAVEKVCRLRGLDPAKAMLSIVCKDISQIQTFSHQIDNQVFKLMHKNLPGPFTFVLPSSNAVPKIFKNKKRTIGVRIPDHAVPLSIVERLGRPILTTSLKSDDEILEYFTDPIDIHEEFQKLVDLVIDSGYGGNNPSTIVDCTGEEPVVTRQGAGVLV